MARNQHNSKHRQAPAQPYHVSEDMLHEARTQNLCEETGHLQGMAAQKPGHGKARDSHTPEPSPTLTSEHLTAAVLLAEDRATNTSKHINLSGSEGEEGSNFYCMQS